MWHGSYRQSEISVNIRNCSITVGTYFHDRSTDNGFTTRFFQRQYLLPGLAGQRNRYPQRKTQLIIAKPETNAFQHIY